MVQAQQMTPLQNVIQFDLFSISFRNEHKSLLKINVALIHKMTEMCGGGNYFLDVEMIVSHYWSYFKNIIFNIYHVNRLFTKTYADTNQKHSDQCCSFTWNTQHHKSFSKTPSSNEIHWNFFYLYLPFKYCTQICIFKMSYCAVFYDVILLVSINTFDLVRILQRFYQIFAQCSTFLLLFSWYL